MVTLHSTFGYKLLLSSGIQDNVQFDFTMHDTTGICTSFSTIKLPVYSLLLHLVIGGDL